MAQDLHTSLTKLEDPFLRRTVKTALHLRRYMPFYVFGTVWAVTLALFPSIGPNSDSDDGLFAGSPDTGAISAPATGTVDAGGAATDAAGGATDAAAATGGATTGATGARRATGTGGAKVAAGTGAAAGGAASSAPISGEVAASAVQRGTGKTRLGLECKEGQPQIPNSSYSIPCQNVYDGPNGGATYRGVTDKEIIMVRRGFPDSANSQAVAAVVEAAGGASEEEAKAVRDAFIEYFNKSFELYGRTVKWVDYETKNSASSTDEAQSKGKEKACLDAEDVKSLNAFAVPSASAPFSECAADRKIMVFDAGAYYPETWFKKYHPYLWGGPMECERISYQLSEYIGKRLINRPAKWAGDAVTRAKTRYFGTYVPDNDGYQYCVSITKSELKNKYGVKDTGPQYNYQLDVSRFPDQAAQATVQFAAAGVTTLILACDAISAIVLTEAATKQQWNPEWMTIGTGLTDLDNAARLYDQVQVDGHLFGVSQLGATDKLIGPTSEPGIIYKQATGKTIVDGTDGGYFGLIRYYSMLQAAGPNLTPQSVAAGVRTMPPSGAPAFPAGYSSFLDGPDGTPGAGDHTAVDDSREVFWVNGVGNTSSDKSSCTKNSDPWYNGADGCAGTYKEAQGGRRFRNGEWTKEEPPIFPANH
jgi:hypothetical protein